MYVLGAFNVVAALMMFVFRAPDHVDEAIDDYAGDHSHVSSRGRTPPRTQAAGGSPAGTAAPASIKP